MIVLFSARCYDTLFGFHCFEDQSRARHQVDFEDVVNPLFERYLEALGQAGRWSNDAKHPSFWQERDPAFSSFVKVNSHEGCLCKVRSGDRTRAFQANHAGNHLHRRHYGSCHLNTLHFYRCAPFTHVPNVPSVQKCSSYWMRSRRPISYQNGGALVRQMQDLRNTARESR